MTLTNRNLPSGLRVFVSGATKTSVANKGQRLDRVLEWTATNRIGGSDSICRLWRFVHPADLDRLRNQGSAAC